MTSNWLIALPCWGAQYRKRFADFCWPSWQAALAPIKDRCRIMLHTDDPSFCALFDGVEMILRAPPDNDRRNQHGAFSKAHLEALAFARMGEIVAIQNADHILSIDAFAAAERRLAAGRKLIMCAGTRTVGPLFGNPPPVLPAAQLLEWALHHAHTITQQSTYPHGKCGVSSTLYFSDGGNTILRGFHLHPFAAFKDRDLTFAGTVDRDLPDNFSVNEIHVVTDKNELAQAEISPWTRHFALRPEAMTEDYLYGWALRNASDMHWHFFQHRIVLKGSAETYCDLMAERLLARRRRDVREAA